MASKGNIVVFAAMAGQNLPVKDAVVIVTQDSGDKAVLLGVRKTDESGKTTPIEVETPDVEYSLEPESTVQPFAAVNVRVDHPAVYTVITKNVQVFADNDSVINVTLIPLEENVDNDNRNEVIDITPQNL